MASISTASSAMSIGATPKAAVSPLPPSPPHILRHTFCTGLVRRGLDVKSVQYLMGHASAGVTLDVYSHVNYTDVKEKMLDLAS